MKSAQHHELLFVICLIGTGLVHGPLGLALLALASTHLVFYSIDYWKARPLGTRVDVATMSSEQGYANLPSRQTGRGLL